MSFKPGRGLSPRERRERRRRVSVAVIALLAVLGLVLPTVAALLPPARGAVATGTVATSAAAHGTVATSAAATSVAAPSIGAAAPTASVSLPAALPASTVDPVPGPVVFIGTAGVAWTDVTVATTPRLWELGTTSSGANLVVRSQRSSTCPADGWLAISTGIRAADIPMEQYGACRQLRAPATGEPVTGWEDFRAAADASNYAAEPGTFGETLAAADVVVRGIGPGAAVALADFEGVPVGQVSYLPSTTDQLVAHARDALDDDPDLLIVDIGSLRDSNRPLVTGPKVRPVDVPKVDPSQDSVFSDPDAEEEERPITEWLARPSKATQLMAIDARLGTILDMVQEEAPDATIIVASLADTGTRSGLRLLAANGPGFTDNGPGILRADSTRQTGLVQTFDLPSTMLAALDVEAPPAMSGSMFVTNPDSIETEDSKQHRRILHLRDYSRKASAVPPVAPTFTIGLIVLNLLIYAATTLGLNLRVHAAIRRQWPRVRDSRLVRRVVSAVRKRLPAIRRARVVRGLSAALSALFSALRRLPPVRRLIESFQEQPTEAYNATAAYSGLPVHVVIKSLKILRAVALAIAALPVSATLANLVPWWRLGASGFTLIATVTAWAALIATVALAGPWRCWLLGPLGVVAGITALTLGVDVATGATLQLANVLGTQPQVAGRFYGLNNQSFALFAVSMLLLAMCVAEPLVRAGRRRLAGAIVLAIGVVEVIINGHPSIGADFGGPPATVPGFLVLALMTAGIRITWKKVIAIGLAAVVVVSSFAITDYLRPVRERTHLGNFVQTVLDGGLWDVVARKAGANLSLLFGTPLTFLVLGALAVLILILTQPLRRDHREAGKSGDLTSSAYGWLTGGPSILRLDRACVMLRPGIISIAVTLTIGFAMNDSGIVIPAMGLSLFVPLLIAVLATWLLRLQEVTRLDEPQNDEPQKDEPQTSNAR